MMPTNEGPFLHELESEMDAERATTGSSHPEEALGVSPAEWLLDPTDVEREDVGLRSLLGRGRGSGELLAAGPRIRYLTGAREKRTQRRRGCHNAAARSLLT
jgi:hypothetical protein